MTRIEEMKKLATEEAVKLKEYATQEELAMLDLDELNPLDERSCIYGLMTGNCNSKRAHNLIMKCANRVYNTSRIDFDFDKTATLNGEPYDIKNFRERSQKYQSPIEMLIYSRNGGAPARRKLIAFLKDETQTLEL